MSGVGKSAAGKQSSKFYWAKLVTDFIGKDEARTKVMRHAAKVCFEKALQDDDDEYMTCSHAVDNAASLVKDWMLDNVPRPDELDLHTVLMDAAIKRVDWGTVMRPFVDAELEQFKKDVGGF